MKFNFEIALEKRRNFISPFNKLNLGRRKDNQIVHIAEIIMAFENMFYELVKLVKVKVGKELGGQITDWQSLILRGVE